MLPEHLSEQSPRTEDLKVIDWRARSLRVLKHALKSHQARCVVSGYYGYALVDKRHPKQRDE